MKLRILYPGRTDYETVHGATMEPGAHGLVHIKGTTYYADMLWHHTGMMHKRPPPDGWPMKRVDFPTWWPAWARRWFGEEEPAYSRTIASRYDAAVHASRIEIIGEQHAKETP